MGGGCGSPFWKTQSKSSSFSFQTNKQYLIWKLRSFAKIWYPIEVAEVKIAASGGRRTGQGPIEKKVWSKFWNLQFLSYTNIIHLKRKLRTIFIQIWNKIRGFCYEKVEKKSILWFSIQKIIISARSRLNFWKTCQDSKKMTWLPCSWDVYG